MAADSPTTREARREQHSLPKRAAAFFRVFHLFPTMVVVATTTVLLLIAHGGNPGWQFLLRGAAVILGSQVAVGALNDYLDREDDALFQPTKPIPSGLVSPRAALALAAAGLGWMLVLGATFGPWPLALVIVGVSGGIAYDLWLKPTPASILGYLVGFMSLITWIWTVAGHLTAIFWLTYPIGTGALIAVHLAQSFPDIESDQALGHEGLAAHLGPLRVFRTILTLYALICTAAIAAFVLSRDPRCALLSSVGLGIGAVAAWICRDAPRDRHARVRLFHLVGPGVALLACACLLALKDLE